MGSATTSSSSRRRTRRRTWPPGPGGSATGTSAWARTACSSTRPPPTASACGSSTPTAGKAEISGNGLRCLAGYMVWTRGTPAAARRAHRAGPRPVDVEETGRARYRITTDLGEAILESARIPVALDPPAVARRRPPLARGRRDRARDRDVAGQPALRGVPRRAGRRRAAPPPRAAARARIRSFRARRTSSS